MKGERVIVTGGLGFIHSHLVEKLAKSNDVEIIDNPSKRGLENVLHLSNGGLKIVEGNSRDSIWQRLSRSMSMFFIKLPSRAFQPAFRTYQLRTRPTSRGPFLIAVKVRTRQGSVRLSSPVRSDAVKAHMHVWLAAWPRGVTRQSEGFCRNAQLAATM